MSLSYVCVMFIVNKVQFDVLFVAQKHIHSGFSLFLNYPHNPLPMITVDNREYTVSLNFLQQYRSKESNVIIVA